MNAVLVTLFAIVAWIAVVRTLTYFFPSIPNAGTLACFVLYVGLAIKTLAAKYHGERIRGPILIDCGPHHAKRALWLITLVLVLLGINTALGHPPFPPVFAVLFFTSAGLSIWSSYGRIAIHEHGIWVYESLVLWPAIRKFSWSGNTLVLTGSHIALIPMRKTLPIPEGHVKTVKKALDDNVKSQSAA
jgi:hypothetical protein